ncbi:hypothetical protein [Croceicoccus gelatinilyticus]|uniref:hypothetical protein n=1 Tax=Croceicoccus gelatinilyticus TaxID=2835536 RepID=UPI001BCB9621|nr:hypothetical protein [Croceicoccus gelatinilyticus]MBS7668365.1 hypothetical protein [Croceicoccus gelatinilyticus]
MSNGAKKLIIFLVLAVIATVVSFFFAEDIRTWLNQRGGGQNDEVRTQCIAEYTQVPLTERRAGLVCDCLIVETKRQKLQLEDLLGTDAPEMQSISSACMQMHAG